MLGVQEFICGVWTAVLACKATCCGQCYTGTQVRGNSMHETLLPYDAIVYETCLRLINYLQVNS